MKNGANFVLVFGALTLLSAGYVLVEGLRSTRPDFARGSATILALTAFSAQVFLTAVEQFIYRILPFAQDVAGWVGLSRLVPLVMLSGALYALFYSLTPSKYRYSSCPKWPGALFTSLNSAPGHFGQLE